MGRRWLHTCSPLFGDHDSTKSFLIFSFRKTSRTKVFPVTCSAEVRYCLSFCFWNYARFLWQPQQIRHFWKVRDWLCVAGACKQTLARCRRTTSRTLLKRWQAQLNTRVAAWGHLHNIWWTWAMLRKALNACLWDCRHFWTWYLVIILHGRRNTLDFGCLRLIFRDRRNTF